MYPRSASVQVVTARIAEVRAFYQEHFDAIITFDCGWYVVLRLGAGEGAPELCFMEPRAGSSEYAGGVTLNLRFDDVDAVHERLSAAGVEVSEPLADHPWGDRGFGILDPSGLAAYCYHDIPMTDEFKPFLVLDPGQREGEQ
jgi:predicted enzyme related to lactoylglutathione lyase